MQIKLFIPVIASTLFILSCGNTEGSTSDSLSEKLSEQLENVDSPVASSPCEFISAEEIRTICEVASEFEIEQQDKVYTHPTCKFRWEDGKVKNEMEIGGRKMTVDQASEVMIVMVVDANESAYERSIKVYRDGVNVDNLAEKAIWGAEMSQLSFLKSGYLFHVHVETSNDIEKNKQQAMDLAKKLISAI